MLWHMQEIDRDHHYRRPACPAVPQWPQPGHSIPREFELPGEEAILRKEGNTLVIEPIPTTPLRALLAQWAPLEDAWPDIGDLPAEAVDL